MADLSTPYSTRLCFSGVESRKLLETFADFGIKHLQVSYYYLRRVFNDPKDFEEFIRPFTTIIVDSGTVYHKFKTPEQKTNFLEDYGAYIAALDKRSISAAVYEEGAGLETALPEEMLIYPLDDIRGAFDNDLEAVCKEIKYLGVGMGDEEHMDRIFAHAKKRGAYIHGFAISSKKLLFKYPFYSTNSSSWRSGSRYLNTYVYEGSSRGARLFQPRDKKDPLKTERELKTVRRRQENLVKVKQPHIYPLIEWGALYDGDSWEVDKANLAQWLLYAGDLELMAQNKYWLSDEDKRDMVAQKRALLGTDDNPVNRDIGREDINDQVFRGGDTDAKQEKEDGGSTPHDEEARAESSEGGRSTEDGEFEEITDAEVVDEKGTGGVEIAPLPDATIGPPRTERITPVDDRMKQLRQCNFCILADKCAKYQEGGLCAYGLPPENPTYDHNSMDEHLKVDFADIMALQKDRIMQEALSERLEGAGLSKDLTSSIKLWAEVVQLYREAMNDSNSLEIKAKGPDILDMFKPRR